MKDPPKFGSWPQNVGSLLAVRAFSHVSLSPVQATSAFQGHDHNKLSRDGSEQVSDSIFFHF